jgi:uncharacterized protein (DUF1330 family)
MLVLNSLISFWPLVWQSHTRGQVGLNGQKWLVGVVMLITPAYIVARLTVNDRALFRQYADLARVTVIAHDGEFIIGSAGKSEVLEGPASQPTFVMVKFPDYDCLLRWYHSDEYQALKEIRLLAATGTVIAYEGIAASL